MLYNLLSCVFKLSQMFPTMFKHKEISRFIIVTVHSLNLTAADSLLHRTTREVAVGNVVRKRKPDDCSNHLSQGNFNQSDQETM